MRETPPKIVRRKQVRIMIRATIALIMTLMLLSAGCRDTQEQIPTAAELQLRAECERLSVTELIDRLQQVEHEGIGYHSTAWARGFVGVDEEAAFAGGVLGSHAPIVAPQLRELVRRGIAALPELLEHLPDSRDTSVTVGGHVLIEGRWFSNEYDPRDLPPETELPVIPHVPTWTEQDFTGSYTLRVGDLCFVAIGQIVNRRLYAVRYQPTSCLVVNSPVELPDLAEAVRNDWAGLDRTQHCQSLIHDLELQRDPWRAEEAWKRLSFYYPETARELKHLQPHGR